VNRDPQICADAASDAYINRSREEVDHQNVILNHEKYTANADQSGKQSDSNWYQHFFILPYVAIICC